MVIDFVFLWPSFLSYSIVYFQNGPEYIPVNNVLFILCKFFSRKPSLFFWYFSTFFFFFLFSLIESASNIPKYLYLFLSSFNVLVISFCCFLFLFVYHKHWTFPDPEFCSNILPGNSIWIHASNLFLFFGKYFQVSLLHRMIGAYIRFVNMHPPLQQRKM